MSDNSRVRVSIVGVVVVALFCTLLARLWFLQAGPDNSLKVQAIADHSRVIQTESPRGEILDRQGRVLVKDRASWAVTLDRKLPTATATRVLGQLAEQLNIPVKDLRSQYESARQSPLEPAIVALDVKQPDRLSIMQDPQDYPGVNVMQLTVREYPQGELAAQLLGYVGEIPADQLAALKNKGYETGDEIGRAGAEAAFESVLRGKPRSETILVDPRGQQVGAPVSVQKGAVGANVYLTIDSTVQRAAEDSLAQGIAQARTLQNVNVKQFRYETLKAPAGSAVVLDASNGAIAAMASFPTYSPDWFVGGISQTHYADLTQNPFVDHPLINRATQGVYAPGSTFKLVTSLAMAKNGIQDPNQYINDTGSVRIQGTTFHNANNGEVLGSVNLQSALTKSSDVYFYDVGYNFWRTWKSGDTARGLGIQAEARDLGFGSPTGVQLSEVDGRVPDPAWKSAFAHANYKSARQKRENSIWYPYDNLSLAVGQGDLVATPLQLANAYAAFDNGGTLWHPNLEEKVVQGGVTKQITPRAIRHLSFDPNLHTQMMAGFQGAISDPKGTAYQAFQGFPLTTIPVAGKTGTAQVTNKGDTSIFVGMFSAQGHQYVVAVVMEQAGFGAQSAAPVARRIIEAMNGLAAPAVQVIASGHD